jgi:hypothetical protein
MRGRFYKDTPGDNTVNIDSGQQTVILAVAEALLAVSMDQIISYGELSRVAERNVQHNDHRWIVTLAREQVNKTHGLMFACERKVGYRRLSSESGVKFAGENGIKRTRSAARNGSRRLQNALATANELAPAEQKLANQRLATFGMVDYLTKARTVKTLPDTAPEPDGLAGLRTALGL